MSGHFCVYNLTKMETRVLNKFFAVTWAFEACDDHRLALMAATVACQQEGAADRTGLPAHGYAHIRAMDGHEGARPDPTSRALMNRMHTRIPGLRNLAPAAAGEVDPIDRFFAQLGSNHALVTLEYC